MMFPYQSHDVPDWMLHALLDPPWYVEPAVYLTALLVIALAALGYARHGIDEDVIMESTFNLLVAMSAMVFVSALGKYVSTPFSVDIITSGVGAFLLVSLAFSRVNSTE